VLSGHFGSHTKWRSRSVLGLSQLLILFPGYLAFPLLHGLLSLGYIHQL